MFAVCCLLVLFSALLAHTHAHTHSSSDQGVCFDPRRGFTFNGQAVNTQHAQLVDPISRTGERRTAPLEFVNHVCFPSNRSILYLKPMFTTKTFFGAVLCYIYG